MYVLLWMLIGLAAGILARFLLQTRSAGWLADLTLGTLGGLLGGWITRLGGLAGPQDFVRHLGSALLGSMLLLALIRRLKPVATRAHSALGGAAVADLPQQIARLGDRERKVLRGLLGGSRTARDPNVSFEEKLTFGQRVADQVAAFGGSWAFIGLFAVVIALWLILNTEAPRRFDPYPFILLNLLLSLVAALQAPVILMSQNRQAAKDRHDARLDYEVNLRAELEIARLHLKLDAQREVELREILEIQRKLLTLLERGASSPEGS